MRERERKGRNEGCQPLESSKAWSEKLQHFYAFTSRNKNETNKKQTNKQERVTLMYALADAF